MFRIFFLFFLLGEGEGGIRGAGGGDRFLLKVPGRGGILQEGEGPRRREGVCGKLGNWGGGAKFFFSGPKRPPRVDLQGAFV